jgi:transketolase
LSVRVINLHTIKPIDEAAILRAVEDTRRIVTFEDHNVIGGLGTAVADVIAGSGKGCAFKKVGLPDEYAIVGYPEDIQSYYKLDTDGVVTTVREVMGRDFEPDEDWEDEV